MDADADADADDDAPPLLPAVVTLWPYEKGDSVIALVRILGVAEQVKCYIFVSGIENPGAHADAITVSDKRGGRS